MAKQKTRIATAPKGKAVTLKVTAPNMLITNQHAKAVCTAFDTMDTAVRRSGQQIIFALTTSLIETLGTRTLGEGENAMLADAYMKTKKPKTPNAAKVMKSRFLALVTARVELNRVAKLVASRDLVFNNHMFRLAATAIVAGQGAEAAMKTAIAKAASGSKLEPPKNKAEALKRAKGSLNRVVKLPYLPASLKAAIIAACQEHGVAVTA